MDPRQTYSMSQYFQLLPDYTAIQTVVSLFHIDKLQHDVYLLNKMNPD